MFNIVASHPDEAITMARAELARDCARNRGIAQGLLDEAEWLKESRQ